MKEGLDGFTQKELETRILEANQAYRDGKPFLLDTEYDLLESLLKREFPESSLLENSKLSISQKQLRKRKLPIEMRSLDKCKSIQEVLDWLDSKDLSLEDTQLVLTPKYDGISILRNESTSESWTSGDGFEGQICTEHLDYTLRQDLETSYCYSVGEAIISISDWNLHFKDKISSYSGQPFKASRNTVAGLFNNDNPATVQEYLSKVRYIPYTLFSLDQQLLSDFNKVDMLDIINNQSLDFKVPFQVLFSQDLSERLLEALYERWSKDYKIDGIVIDINSRFTRDELGYESNSNPAFARALKLPQWTEDVVSITTKIEKQVSKQGLIKPVVCIEPIQVGDVTVSRANGLNMKFINDWHLDKGIHVSLIRSGDVIPRLKSVEGIEIPYRENFKTQGEYEYCYRNRVASLTAILDSQIDLSLISLDYQKCPCCNSELKWTETGVDQYCPNEYCFDRLVKQLSCFIESIGITGVGEITCQSLVKYIRSKSMIPRNGVLIISGFLQLTTPDFLQLEGFAEKSASQLFRQILKIKKTGVSLSKLWYGLGIFKDLGEKTLQNIINELEINSLDKLSTITEDQLLRVGGVALQTSKAFQDGVQTFLQVQSIISIPISKYNEEKQVDSNGIIVCCTQFRFNEEEKKILRSKGYTLTDSFTNRVNILVNGGTSETEKIKKARVKGVKIITRSQINEL